MIVYNIGPNFCEGVYVWNGNQWRKVDKDYQERASALNNLVITAPAADEIVGGDAVTFKATPDNAKFYSWYLNDTLLATTPSSIFTTTAIREGTNHKMKVVLDDCLSLSSAEITFNAVKLFPASMPESGGGWIRIYNGNPDSPFPYAATSEYIQEGLVAHYDGINNVGLGDKLHSSTTDTWVNLKGEDTLPNALMCTSADCRTTGLGGHIEWKSNSAYFKASNDSNWFRIYKTDYVPEQYTLEVVYKTNAAYTTLERDLVSNWQFGGFGFLSGNYFDSDKVGLMQWLETESQPAGYDHYKTSYGISFAQGELLTLSGQLINNEDDGCWLSVYVDGEGLSKKLSNDPAIIGMPVEPTVWSIGADPRGEISLQCYQKDAYFYSVRLYNTGLTLEQIQHNVVLDHKRYLAPPVVTIDNIPCTNVTVLSPRCLTCQVPPGTQGTVDVKVFQSNGTTEILTYEDVFTYTP
jgi:hypothetical protein